MARISYVESENASPEVAKLFAIMEAASGSPVIRLWKMIAHVPAALPHLMKLGNALLFKGKLDPKLRELAILRVAALIDCAYERQAHSIIGLEVGLSREQVEGTKDWTESAAFSEVERAVLRFVDEVTATARAKDETFAQLASFLGEDEMVELTLVSANYGMLGRILLAFAVDPEVPNVDSFSRLNQAQKA